MQFYAKNAIHLLSLLSDVKVMTSTVAVIFAIT